MISDFDLALLIGVAIVVLASWRTNRRALLWIAAAALDFIVSTAYWRSGLPYGAAAGAFCDGMVVLAANHFGRARWELGVRPFFQASVAVNISFVATQLMGIRLDQDILSIVLEAINWAFLLFLFWVSGTPDWLANVLGIPDTWRPRRVLLRARVALQQERRSESFWTT